MAIERFQGKYITAEDATRTIDVPTIYDGCKMMKSAADKLDVLTKKIDVLRETYNRDAFSVSEEIVEEYEKRTNNFSLYINDLAEMIEKTTTRVANRKQIILNEEAKRLDEQEALLHNDVSINSPETNDDSETISINNETNDKFTLYTEENEDINEQIDIEDNS